jgi:hypothetical protein
MIWLLTYLASKAGCQPRLAASHQVRAVAAGASAVRLMVDILCAPRIQDTMSMLCMQL